MTAKVVVGMASCREQSGLQLRDEMASTDDLMEDQAVNDPNCMSERWNIMEFSSMHFQTFRGISLKHDFGPSSVEGSAGKYFQREWR